MRHRALAAACAAIVSGILATASPAVAESVSENCNDSGQCLTVLDASVTRYRTVLTVEGSGFTPNTTVEIHQEGSRPGGHIFTNVKKNMTVTADADGRFHVTFKAQKLFRASCDGNCEDGRGGNYRWVNCTIHPCYLFAYGDPDDVGTDLYSVWGFI